MKLLLDVHISKATLGGLAKAAPDVQAEHVADWRGGSLRNASDAEILMACQEEHRVLVTFDLATIPGLLRHWAAEGREHAGVIFGDEKTVRPGHAGEMAIALKTLAAEVGGADTTNMVRFLQRRGD